MEFKTLLLKDLTKKINSGSTPRGGKDAYKENGLIKLIRSQNIYNHQFAKEGLVFISEDQAEKLKNVIVKKNDILLNITGDSVARCTISEDDMLPARVNQHVMIIRVNEEELNPYFLLAYLTSESIQNYLLSISQGGGTRAALTKKMVECLEIPVPSLQIQALIAANLKSINEKIKININTIENLEIISVNLFKNWFIDFEFSNEEGQPYKSSGGKMVESELGMIPEGFEYKNLRDIGKITMGLSPKSESYNESLIGLPLLNGAADFKGSKLVPKKYTTDSKRNSSIGDLIFCIRATIGNISYSDKEYSLGRSVASITPRNEKYYELIYFHLEKQIEQLKSQAVGSVIIGLSKPDIENIPIVYPTARVLHEFYQLMNPIFKQVRALRLENEKLAELRDTLLPKLISGEIEVPVKEPENV